MKNRPVLLVEDDENDVTFMRYAWSKAGLANPLHLVADGQSAIDYLRGSGQYADRKLHPLPFLMFLDLNLPHRSGFEVLQWIRQRPELRALLVVVLTSSTADCDAHRAYGLGANSYVVKPSDLEALKEFLIALKTYWVAWNYVPARSAEEEFLSAGPAAAADRPSAMPAPRFDSESAVRVLQ